MRGRVSTFIVSAAFASILVGCVYVGIVSAGKKKPITLDMRKALVVDIPWAADKQIEAPHVWFTHVCCACASTHRVLAIASSDGIRMYWWTDNLETRRQRQLKGIEIPDPWSVREAPPIP